MGEEDSNFKNFLSNKFVIVISLVLIFINLAYIDILTFTRRSPEALVQKVYNITPTITPSLNKPTQPTQIPDQLCPKSCISQIYEATASYKLASQPQPAPTAIPAQQNAAPSSVKEFFIPFGSGSSSARDWEDIAGIQASVDTANYSNLKSITFEASIRIPTGNEIAYVRLFNVTDKHPVWFSEVSLEGGTPKLLVSKPITLDSGNKTYQVQMKTSLKYQAFFDQARLHILTN